MNVKIKIALAQLDCDAGNKEANLLRIEQAIEKADEQQADILLIPEMMLTGFVERNELIKLAEKREGESFKRIIKSIKKHHVAVLFTFPEYVSDQLVYNTACFIDKEGIPIEYYRKTHLFDTEKLLINPGMELSDLSFMGINIGILTCFDIEFPEVARTLGLRGMHLLLVNSANMSPYENLHRNCIQARAMENHCFVAYCNRVGENSSYVYRGQSAVIAPNGNVLMEIEDGIEDVRTVEISLSDIELSKSIFNYYKERRPELYH